MPGGAGRGEGKALMAANSGELEGDGNQRRWKNGQPVHGGGVGFGLEEAATAARVIAASQTEGPFR